MSRKHKKQNVEEPVVDVTEEVTNESNEEEDEMKETKTGIFKTIGGAISKAAHSKAGKIVGGVTAVAALIGAGYALGKNGLPDFGKDSDDDDFYDETDDSEDEEVLGIDVDDEDDTTE